MQTKIVHWEDLDFTEIRDRIFQVQRRIFRASIAGNRDKMHKAQLRLIRSFPARCYAVYLAAEKSKGRNTAGVDGMRKPSESQKLKMAQSLRLTNRPAPVRRKLIPKPGSLETRSLGIPTLSDRALQHLINLALEPEWEARFGKSTFGFRKGRSCHDALGNIRQNIRQCPKWVLDGDIEKFFDRLDHSAILKKLDTFPRMEKAVRSILKAGFMDGSVFDPTEVGTPQGGPLSPLLANIALCGLEQDLIEAFPPKRVINGTQIKKSPRLIIYADDFVCLHDSRDVIEETRSFISTWLKPLGLNLSPTKTKVAHTLLKVDGKRGFEFLGCQIRQHRVGRHQLKPFFKGIHTHIEPSQKSQTKIYEACAGIIDKMVHSKKRNAQFAHRQKKGASSAQEIMIHQLNRKLKGWARYFSSHNSKRAFSTLDNKIFIKLFRWAKRRHPKWVLKRLIDEFFNGGNPWIFRSNREEPQTEIDMLRVDSTPISHHSLVKSKESYFNGDWTYWGKRQGTYPGMLTGAAKCLQRQHGKCWHCNLELERHITVQVQIVPNDQGRAFQRLVHESCAARNARYLTRDAFIRQRRESGARCHESGTPGSEKP